MANSGKEDEKVSIQDLCLIYDDSFAHFHGPESVDEAVSLGESLARRTQNKVTGDIATKDSRVLASWLGKRKALARIAGVSDQIIAADIDFATLVKNTIFPNRDNARDYAASVFLWSAERLIGIGDVEYAAMQMSNAAEVLLEKSRISESDVERAKAALEKSTKWRRKNSVDMGVHLVNVALLRKTLIRKGVETPSPETLKNVMRTLEKGFKLASQPEPIGRETLGAQDIEEIYHHNVVELLDLWLNVEIHREELNFAVEVSRRVHRALSVENLPLETLVGVVSLLRVNPKSLGIEETPEWVLPKKSIIDRACKSIPGFEARIEAAFAYLEKNPGALRLASILQRVSSSLETIEETSFAAFLSGLERANRGQDDQLFLQRILSLVQNVDLVPRDQSKRYVEILGRTPSSLARAKRLWTTERFREFMLRYRLELRWVACELAQAGRWGQAFELLSAVTGAVASPERVNEESVRLFVCGGLVYK